MLVDIRKPLKKLTPMLIEARDERLNEADTVHRICHFFDKVLGYDPLRDIGREAEMKGKYVDVTVKIDNQVRLLVEAKAAGVRLRDRHIDQAKRTPRATTTSGFFSQTGSTGTSTTSRLKRASNTSAHSP